MVIAVFALFLLQKHCHRVDTINMLQELPLKKLSMAVCPSSLLSNIAILFVFQGLAKLGLSHRQR